MATSVHKQHQQRGYQIFMRLKNKDGKYSVSKSANFICFWACLCKGWLDYVFFIHLIVRIKPRSVEE